MPEKDDHWFATLNWSKTCLKCKSGHGGECPSRSCAEFYYDPWGDELPASLCYPDGNDEEKYLSEKLKRMEKSVQ